MENTFLLHALPEVLIFEGKISDDANDPGGLTAYGITHDVYTAYLERKGLPIVSVIHITPSQVADIYKTEYWDVVKGDLLPYPIDWVTFDAAVNLGPSAAIHFLDAALELPQSCGIDAQVVTAAKLNCKTLAGTHTLKERELSERIERYHEIVQTHANQNVFLQGWLNRCKELDEES